MGIDFRCRSRFRSVARRARTSVAVCAVLIAGFPAKAAPSAAELEQAGNLFAISCSSSFCHGAGGVGARGPALRDRDFTPDYVRTTMLNGRTGTAMPAFKGALSSAEVDMIVAYVMSLSPNADTGAAAAPAVPDLTEIGPLDPAAQAGADIFFDLARPNGCSLCHSYAQRGGPIGQDLTTIAKLPARELYDRILKPPAQEPGYPTVVVTTRDGRRITGIKQFQDSAVVRLYDLSSAPPVLRSFYTADGASVAAGPASYTHDLHAMTEEQVANLLTFLKSAAGGKDVTPQDFARSAQP
jgi:putative heme-binding domain-containing protein